MVFWNVQIENCDMSVWYQFLLGTNCSNHVTFTKFSKFKDISQENFANIKEHTVRNVGLFCSHASAYQGRAGRQYCVYSFIWTFKKVSPTKSFYEISLDLGSPLLFRLPYFYYFCCFHNNQSVRLRMAYRKYFVSYVLFLDCLERNISYNEA